ncbi:MAG: hypothetical protein H8E33_03375 [Candidatus Cloacimonetes bacterium]|nr:hypothetical protein [Candidatus Cloacimonadota bacterium]
MLLGIILIVVIVVLIIIFSNPKTDVQTPDKIAPVEKVADTTQIDTDEAPEVEPATID